MYWDLKHFHIDLSSPNHHKNPDYNSDMKSGIGIYGVQNYAKKILAYMVILDQKTFSCSYINNSESKAKYE